jgi:NAD(P)-dependent dehydrogenase (short-subunit alcohol dehydrogenase family)
LRLGDKVAVVTGAATGIGAALVRRFAAEGARVVAAGHDPAGLAAVAAETGGLAVECEVTAEAEIKRLVAAAESHFGPVDVFFSNAGVTCQGHEDASDMEWAQSWATHVMAHVYAARAVLPGMLARGSGYLLSSSSGAGLLASMYSAPYGVTKHAAVALAEHLAIQYGDRGIRVSVLCPQAVDTGMLKRVGSSASSVDGVLSPAAVADCVVEAMDKESFLILPHPGIAEYAKRKAGDPDRWLKGMQRLRERMKEG